MFDQGSYSSTPDRPLYHGKKSFTSRFPFIMKSPDRMWNTENVHFIVSLHKLQVWKFHTPFFIFRQILVSTYRDRESLVRPVDKSVQWSVTGGNCIAGGARVHRVILGPASVGTRQPEVVWGRRAGPVFGHPVTATQRCATQTKWPHQTRSPC